MAEQSLPKFLFDVFGWRSSRAIQRMSFLERGVYWEMLLEQWEKRNLPDNAEAVADAIAVTDAQAAEVLAAWPVVRRKFLTSRGDDTRIYNATMERTRREQREYRRKRQDAGSRGRKAKSVNHTKDKGLLASNATALLEVATAKPSVLVEEREGKVREGKGSEERTGGGVPPLAGKEPPMQLHLRRLKVWRWMLDRWAERLGDHLDAFDLHGWLSDVDEQVAGVVLPSSGQDWWLFLDARFGVEVRRRGLPVLAAPAPMGKQTTKLAAALASIKAAEAV